MQLTDDSKELEASTSEATARYVQIAEALQHEIQTLGPNTLLPTENALATKFSVSRLTVRSALSLLERAGTVTRTRGRGTVVNPPKVVRNNIPMQTLEDDFKRQGIPFITNILSFNRRVPPPVHVQQSLHLTESDMVGHLCLTRIVDGQTVCFEDRYFIAEVATDFDPECVHQKSVRDVIYDQIGSSIDSVELETEILPSEPRVAHYLGITPGSQILRNTFVYFLIDGQPVETGSHSYRVDRCKFRARGRFSLSVD